MKSLLGIGCSTYSYISNSQFFNIYNELKYNDTVKQNKLPIELGRKLSLKEIKIRFIIFGLKKGFSDSEYNSNFCSNVFHDFPLLNKFLEIGLIKRNEDFIDLTSLGSLFADEIGVSLHKTYNSNIEPQS